LLESENIYMLLDSNPNNDAVEKVALFESMIKGETFTFFDVEDFEQIIEYYLELDFKKKAKKSPLRMRRAFKLRIIITEAN